MGAVARNAAIVLEGHVVGALTITARSGSSAIDVGVRTALPIIEDRFADHRVYYLVRPASGAWPGSQTVVLAVIREGVPPEEIEVPIDSMQDTKPPAFVSLVAPSQRTISHPRGDAEVVAIDHGPFVDALTPIVLVTLEIGTTSRTGVVLENRAGTITLQPREDLGAVRTLTIADTAGNANRVDDPCGQPPPDKPGPELETIARDAFTCVVGRLEAVNAYGTFLATTDAATTDGYSRGHYLSAHVIDGDLDITVSATRLTDDHEMSVEIAFRGGYFGVSCRSSWYLYEHPGHWTGWQPTSSLIRPGTLELRVIQRGQRVTGYVNHTLAGSFELERPAPSGRVGIQFKARPGKVGRLRFRNFAVKPVTVDPLEQPCSVTIVQRMIDSPEDLDELSIEERRDSGCYGWKTFPVRSGHLLDTFLLVGTNSDLGVGAYDPEDDDGTMLHTSFLDGPGLADVIERLELLVEKEATITMALLRAHGGGTADKARLEAALRQGEWPESGDPAEETAAFAFHLLAQARDAIQFRAGLLIEHRGALQLRPRQPSAKRVRELEKLLGSIGDAGNMQLNYEMWEARGKEFATEEYRRMMETELAASVRTHRDATAALEALVARTRVEDPEALAAWVDAHDAYLAAFLDDCAEKAKAVLAAPAAAVGSVDRAPAESVRAAEATRSPQLDLFPSDGDAASERDEHGGDAASESGTEATGTDGIAESVATRERAEWAEVRAGTRAFVKQNLFYVTSNDDRYRRLFGIDRKTLKDV